MHARGRTWRFRIPSHNEKPGLTLVRAPSSRENTVYRDCAIAATFIGSVARRGSHDEYGMSTNGRDHMTRRLFPALTVRGDLGRVRERTDGRPVPPQQNPAGLAVPSAPGTQPGEKGAAKPGEPKKFQDFNELTKDAKKYDGFITLHEKEQHLYAEIKPQQLEQPILAPIVIARGSANAGSPLNFGDEWVLMFRRVDDKLQLIRKNIHFTAPAGTPLDKAVKQNYTDSILMALPILSISPNGGALVIDFADIFLTDFAQVGFGNLDRNRSRWFKIRTYPNNVEIQVEATFSGGGFGRYYYFFGGASPIIDPRGITMVIHYSLCKAPDPGYHPRTADYRVGHFLNAVTDYGNPDPDTDARRMINRWRLEKSDPKAKLSPPKKQIVWWIEDNVPVEYRPYVQQGILEWNKAFEKIGFLDAIAVRWQNERDDFEPEDINYCTLRWITTGSTFAMSGLRSDPMTGEMIDGDVIFDASWIKTWKEEYAFLVGVPTPTGAGCRSVHAVVIPLAMGEVISPIMAIKQGFGLPVPPPGSRRAAAFNRALLGKPGTAPAPSRWWRGAMALDVVPSGWDPIQAHLFRRMSQGRFTTCNYSAAKASEMRFASLALALLGRTMTKTRIRTKRKTRKDKETQASRGVPRPGDQGSRDARGRPLAGPAAQFQGQRHAPARPGQRHLDHPRQGDDRQRDGLQPDQHRPQGPEAGRLRLDHDRPL